MKKNRNKNNNFKKAQTRIFKKGYAKATQKHKQSYGLGDFVLDVKTVGLWSVARRIFK